MLRSSLGILELQYDIIARHEYIVCPNDANMGLKNVTYTSLTLSVTPPFTAILPIA